jgi:hypothetical protein
MNAPLAHENVPAAEESERQLLRGIAGGLNEGRDP